MVERIKSSFTSVLLGIERGKRGAVWIAESVISLLSFLAQAFVALLAIAFAAAVWLFVWLLRAGFVGAIVSGVITLVLGVIRTVSQSPFDPWYTFSWVLVGYLVISLVLSAMLALSSLLDS